MPDHPNTAPTFQKATKRKARLRLALSGPSGSGKTYTALTVATRIAAESGWRIAVIDTERGSASKYADEFDFDVLSLDGHYSPARYIDAMNIARGTGAHSVLVIDSLSHAWEAAGGVLDQVDQYASGHRGDSFGGWREQRPEQRNLVDAMLAMPMHVIVTMRTKTAWEMERDDKGKVKPVKLGMKPVQTEGIEYEFDVAGALDLQHTLVIDKTRCRALDNAVIKSPGVELAETLIGWLKSDVVEPQDAPDPRPEAGPEAVAAAQEPEPAPASAEEAAWRAGRAADEAPAAPAPAAQSPAPAAEPQAAATGAPDTRVASAAQIGRAWKLGKGNPVVCDMLDDDAGTATVNDAAMHELVAYLTRDDEGGPVASMKLLTRTQIDRLFTCLEQTKADPALAGRTAAAVQQWIAEQDDVGAVTAGAS